MKIPDWIQATREVLIKYCRILEPKPWQRYIKTHNGPSLDFLSRYITGDPYYNMDIINMGEFKVTV